MTRARPMAWLAAMGAERAELGVNTLRERLIDDCSSFRRISGSTASGVMFLCAQTGAQLGVEVQEDWLDFLLAHEAAHLVQFQVSGARPSGSSDCDRVAAEGPVWLLEGYAQVFANTVATTANVDIYRIIMISRYEGQDLPNLSMLENRGALERAGGCLSRGRYWGRVSDRRSRVRGHWSTVCRAGRWRTVRNRVRTAIRSILGRVLCRFCITNAAINSDVRLDDQRLLGLISDPKHTFVPGNFIRRAHRLVGVV